MKGTVWAQDCRSWYKSNSVEGKVSALWPGSTAHYMEAIKYPRWEDWEFKYTPIQDQESGKITRVNRYNYLGNGFSQTETDPTADWAYYLKNEDDTPFISRMKKLKVVNKAGTFDRKPDIESIGIGL
jgi:hypothetical protein